MQEGINRTTLFAAKKELTIKSDKYAGVRGKWVWVPPSPPEEKSIEATIKEKIAAVRERLEKESKLPAREPSNSRPIVEPESPGKADELPAQAGEYEPEDMFDERITSLLEKDENKKANWGGAAEPIGRAERQEKADKLPAPRDPNLDERIKNVVALVRAKKNPAAEPSA